MKQYIREGAEKRMTKDERRIMNALRLSNGMVALTSDMPSGGVQLSVVFVTDKHKVYGIGPVGADSSNLFAIHLNGFIPVATIDQVNPFYFDKSDDVFQEMAAKIPESPYKGNDNFEEVRLFERDIDYMTGQEYEVVTPLILFGEAIFDIDGTPHFESEGLYRSFEEAFIALNAYVENMKVIGMNPIPVRYIRNRLPGWNKVERRWIAFTARPRLGDEPEILKIRMAPCLLSNVPAPMGADGIIRGYALFDKFDTRETLEERILRVIEDTKELEQELRRKMKESPFVFKKTNASKT